MIIDHVRDVEELKNLYDSRPMPNQYNFEWMVNNPHLYCFYDEEKGFLRGFITVQREEGELTLSGTSIRKNMSDNIDAIIKVCEAYKEDMYSYTPKKEAALVLKKAGFKHIEGNKYRKEYKNGGKQ